MTLKLIIDKFKNDHLTEDEREELFAKAKEKIENLNESHIAEMISWLPNKKLWILQDVIALRLRDLRAHKAVPAIMQAIHAPENEDYRGTLIYALIELNCIEYFPDFITILCTANYECREMCHQLIQKYVDDISTGVKEKAVHELERYYTQYKKMQENSVVFSEKEHTELRDKMLLITEGKELLTDI